MSIDIEGLKADVYDKHREFKEALSRFMRAEPDAITLPAFILGYPGEKKSINPEKLKGCTVLNDRREIIKAMRGSGHAVEVGTQTGSFAKFILDTHPDIHLHVIDLDYSMFRREELKADINLGRITIIEGSSWDELSRFDDGQCDWIYIDASHYYYHVKRDLEAAKKKVRVGGYIICNDYTCWSPFEAEPYGVLQAVNEFLEVEDFVVDYFAFDGYGYHDIAMRRRS